MPHALPASRNGNAHGVEGFFNAERGTHKLLSKFPAMHRASAAHAAFELHASGKQRWLVASQLVPSGHVAAPGLHDTFARHLPPQSG
jgi:hypothetical protein